MIDRETFESADPQTQEMVDAYGDTWEFARQDGDVHEVIDPDGLVRRLAWSEEKRGIVDADTEELVEELNDPDAEVLDKE